MTNRLHVAFSESDAEQLDITSLTEATACSRISLQLCFRPLLDLSKREKKRHFNVICQML